MRWLRNRWFQQSIHGTRRRASAGCRPYRPNLEALEAREVPAGLFLQGTAYIDGNANGHLDSSDTYLPNTTVTLYPADPTNPNLPSSVAQATTTTDGNGAWQFTNLANGTYFVVETAPTGYVNHSADADNWKIGPAATISSSAIQVTLSDAPMTLAFPGLGDNLPLRMTMTNPQSYYGKEFVGYAGELNSILSGGGLTQPYSFITYCIDETRLLSQTGAQVVPSAEPTPPTLTINSGRIAYLYNHYGAPGFNSGDPAKDAVDAAALQAAIWELCYDGDTTPVDLASGNFIYHYVWNGTADQAQAVLDQANFYLSNSVGKSEQAIYLDGSSFLADPKAGSQTGIIGGSLNFGNTPVPPPTGSISGVKFNDLNGDGSREAGEPGLQGWTIQLLDTSDNVLQTTTTDGNGGYSFTGLAAGTYRVREVGQPGWVRMTVNPGDVALASGASVSTGEDFGNFQLVSINGQKFEDVNGDGQTAGDAGLAGVTIDLFKDGAPAGSTTTGADGSFSFSDLGPGTYTVQEEVPAGWTPTLGGSGYTVTPTSGTNSTGNDFANFQLASISGKKFNDANGDGQTAGDAGLSGVTINLFKNGAPAGSTTTTADGSYSFSNLEPGTYTVQEEVPAGWIETVGASGHTVVPQSGSTNTGNDFANFQLVSISGQKFEDVNGNGAKDGGDNGLEGWTIGLYTDAGGVLTDTGLRATTDASGNYSFTGLKPLPAGTTYAVREVSITAGWKQTSANPADVAATSGNAATGADFGNFQLGAIRGFKFQDTNGNRSWDSGEPGLSGWTIQLLDTNGSVLQTTTTGSDGGYSFTGLAAGTYRVREVGQSGWVQMTVNPGDVTVISGTQAAGENFGNFQTITISGKKFNDLTGNGFSSDDTDLGGVTINLFKNGGGTPFASTVTAQDGSYSFADLGPGTYTVQEQVPANAIQTGGIGGYTVGASSGQNAGGRNFADFTKITISGTKFTDLTGNGLTGDDTPLGGVVINLYLNGTKVGTATTDANGNYSFPNQGPGTYTVQEVVPAGWKATVGAGGYTVVATSGTNSTGNNFDNFQLGTISGTKFLDLTGNGFSSDDTGLGGVTIQLLQNGKVIATTTTAADGTYSFTGLTPGLYQVQEVVPNGYVRTGPALASYYAVTLPSVSGSTSTGNNFDNAEKCDLSVLTCYSFKVNNCTTVGDLRGHTDQGDTVTVTFTVAPWVTSHTITLVSYTAPGSSFDANTASQQKIFDIDTGVFGPGKHTLTVTIPNCYYQIDFVCGDAIDQLGPAGSNIFYTPQNRLFSADNGGTCACGTGSGVAAGQFATIGFWHNRNGQAVIKSFDGGYNHTDLGNWMASTFPNLFGASNPYTGTSLAGKTNAQVASIYSNLWNPRGVTKNTYIQAFAVALGVYADTRSLGGQSLLDNGYAAKYGFLVSLAGGGSSTFSLRGSTSAFPGLGNSASVLQILQAVNDNFSPSSGTFYGGSSWLTGDANDVLNGINTVGDISLVTSDSASISDGQPLVSALAPMATGTLVVAVDAIPGDGAAAEQARVGDAIAALNAMLGSRGVTLVAVAGGDGVDADIYLHFAATTVIGGVADGVLGVTSAGNQITIVTGWNYYLGDDPSLIGAGQYDFETVVMHELGHALGLGHSLDTNSLMYPYLGTGDVHRAFTDGDLSVIDADAAIEPLRVAPGSPAAVGGESAEPVAVAGPVVFNGAAPAPVRAAMVGSSSVDPRGLSPSAGNAPTQDAGAAADAPAGSHGTDFVPAPDVLFTRDNSGEQTAGETSGWSGFGLLTFDHLADPSEVDSLGV
jgi:protocatechuate 3,4-dioxygenase beta subunit